MPKPYLKYKQTPQSMTYIDSTLSMCDDYIDFLENMAIDDRSKTKLIKEYTDRAKAFQEGIHAKHPKELAKCTEYLFQNIRYLSVNLYQENENFFKNNPSKLEDLNNKLNSLHTYIAQIAQIVLKSHKRSTDIPSHNNLSFTEDFKKEVIANITTLARGKRLKPGDTLGHRFLKDYKKFINRDKASNEPSYDMDHLKCMLYMDLAYAIYRDFDNNKKSNAQIDQEKLVEKLQNIDMNTIITAKKEEELNQKLQEDLEFEVDTDFRRTIQKAYTKLYNFAVFAINMSGIWQIKYKPLLFEERFKDSDHRSYEERCKIEENTTSTPAKHLRDLLNEAKKSHVIQPTPNTSGQGGGQAHDGGQHK